MSIMYDSINPAAIPADATEILAYTDGQYANVAALQARFPQARLHTISAVGQVVGEWIDVEQGCVWPNQNAAALFSVWHGEGCQGYYSFLNNMQALKEAHNARNPGIAAEYFDANYTQVAHVDPGYDATQYADPGPYDASETTPQFEDTPPPDPAPAPAPKGLTMPFLFTLAVNSGPRAGGQATCCSNLINWWWLQSEAIVDATRSIYQESYGTAMVNHPGIATDPSPYGVLVGPSPYV